MRSGPCRTLDVEVSDDGRGLDATTAAERGHLGLQLLRENLEDFGGHLAWRSRDTGGTVLAAVLPADIAIG